MTTIAKKTVLKSVSDLDKKKTKPYHPISSAKINLKGFTFNAMIEKGENGYYVGQLMEYPEVLSQGKTLKELMDNLFDALKLIMEVNRAETEQKYIGKKTIKRKILARA